MIPLWISTESLLPEEPFSVDGLVTSKSRSENHRNGLSEGVSKETQPLGDKSEDACRTSFRLYLARSQPTLINTLDGPVEASPGNQAFGISWNINEAFLL